MTRATAKPKATEWFSIEQSTLAKRLSAIQGACDSKGTIPILSTVLLETAEDELRLTATDMDVSLETRCSPTVMGERDAAAVKAKLLTAIVSKATGEIRFEKEGTRLKVSYEGTELLLPFWEKAEFPNIPQIDAGAFTVATSLLRPLIYQVEFAIDKTESTYAVIGARLRYKDGRIEMCANDTHRLAVSGAVMESEPIDLLIPKKALDILYGLLEVEGDLQISESENLIRFDTDGMVLTARKLAVKGPNIDLVLNGIKATGSLTLKTKTLKAALERLGDLRDDRTHHVRLKFSNGQLAMEYISSERGQGETRLPIEYSGEPLLIGVDRSYFLDAVRVVDAEEVSLKFSNDSSPVVIESDGYKSVIMTINPKLV